MRNSQDDNPLFEGITTESGKELIDFLNLTCGSAIWGPAREMIKNIEKELK